jgi:hypothetical protein
MTKNDKTIDNVVTYLSPSTFLLSKLASVTGQE